MSSPEALALRLGRSLSEVVGTFKCFVSTMPGVTWVREIEISTFDRDWVLVLSYENGGEDMGVAAFPWIRGFARRVHFPWSVATLLAEDQFGYGVGMIPDSVQSSGLSAFDERLLVVCCCRDDEDVTRGQYLLQLNRGQIRNVLDADKGSDNYGSILEDIADSDEVRAILDEKEAAEEREELEQHQEHERQKAEWERTRIPRLVAWLDDIGSDNAPQDHFLERAAAAFSGASVADTREVARQALQHSDAASRGAVALASLRLNLRDESEYPQARGPMAGMSPHARARGNRNTLRLVLSEDDAKEIIALGSPNNAT